jgi:replicative DNA helicase
MSDATLDLSNLGLELEVVAYALKTGGLPEGVKAEDFHGAKAKWIAEKLEILGPTTSIPILLSELNREGRDEETDEFQSLLERLMAKQIRDAQIPESIERLKELATGRRLADVLMQPGGVAEKLKAQQIKEAVGSLEEFLFAQGAMEGVVSEGDLMSEAAEIMAQIDEIIASEGFEGCPTLIEPLDEVIYGLVPGEYGLLVGGSGEGKSIGLLDIGMRNWDWAGKDVIAFTLEMKKREQQFRQLAWGCGIDIHKFRTGEFDPGEREKISEFFEMRKEKQNVFHWVDIPENVNAAQIERKLLQAERRLKREFEIILIDYLGIMSPIGKYRGTRTDWDTMGETSWNVHNLARRTQKVLWTAVQKKENISEAAKRKGGLGAIGLSYLIAQPADIVVVFIEQTLQGFMEANIAKGRNVPKDRIKLKPDLRHARLHRFAVPEEGEGNTAIAQLD